MICLVLDEGVFMRSNSEIKSFSSNGDYEEDDENEIDWRNVGVEDDRSLDYLALRGIKKGEEIIY